MKGATLTVRSHLSGFAWGRVRDIAAVVILAAGVVGAIARRHDLGAAFAHLGHIHAGWAAVAVVCEAASLVVFTELVRRLLAAAQVPIGLRSLLAITLAANTLSLSLPGGAAVSTGWSYAELRRRGADRAAAGWALLVAGALTSFALFLALAAGVWIAGDAGPVASLRPVVAGLAAIPVAAVGLVWAWRRGGATHRGLAWLVARADAHRWSGAVTVGARRLFGQFARVQPTPAGWAGAGALAALKWAADAGCLAAAIVATGGTVPWRGVLVAYGLGQLAAVLPVTPGGLAIVEGSLTAVLVAYGMAPAAAIAAVLLYRLVSYWLELIPGAVLYGRLAVRAHRDEVPARTEMGAPA